MTERVVAESTAKGRLVWRGLDNYEGTRVIGHVTESKRFHGRRCAVQLEWAEWVEQGRAEREARQRAKARRRQNGNTEEGNCGMQQESKRKDDGRLFALSVVGGAPLYAFDDEDKAFAVCGALTAAAKASGFAAKYDVTEVKKWVE